MFELINYITDKAALLDRINIVRSMFLDFNDESVDLSEAIEKIDSVISNVNKDFFSIVLVGAFSDGKTSVISGWLNEQFENMKIDSDESSDEILVYVPNNLPPGCRIVDTPGLFGEKKGDDGNGKKVVLSDITKKYISEANLILYVVEAKNPIKESHKSCIRWILNDLNKLSSIVFVINKMDLVADLTDDDEFDEQKKIKTCNLRGKLLDCDINKIDADEVKAVCISADPDGEGIKRWENYRDEYLQRSRIGELESEVSGLLKDSYNKLIIKTGCDVLGDELNKILTEIADGERTIQEIIIPEKRESLERNQYDLDILKKRINGTRIDIIEAVNQLKKSKIAKIRSSTIDNFQNVMTDEIGITSGNEGDVLAADINLIFNQYAEKYSEWSINCAKKFNTEFDKQSKAIDNRIKAGKLMSSGMKKVAFIKTDKIKGAIYIGRNILSKIGIGIKFKPWQVVKMAKFTKKAVPIIGEAIELISGVAENIEAEKNNSEFERCKNEIMDSLVDVFRDAIDNIHNDEWFYDNFAPSLMSLDDVIEKEKSEIHDLEGKINIYSSWRQKVYDALTDI